MSNVIIGNFNKPKPIRATDNAVILSTGQLSPEERALFDEIDRIIRSARENRRKLFHSAPTGRLSL